MNEIDPGTEVLNGNFETLFNISLVLGPLLLLIPIGLVALLLRLRLMFRLDMTLLSKEPCPIDQRKHVVVARVVKRTFLTTRIVAERFRGNDRNWRREDRTVCTEAECDWLAQLGGSGSTE